MLQHTDRLRTLISVVTLVVASSIAGAADDAGAGRDAPRSVAAKAAIDKHERVVQKAEAAYRAAMTKANKDLIAELEAAKSAAMRAKNLDEANALNDRIAKAKEAIAALERRAEGPVRSFVVQALIDGDSRLVVRPGGVHWRSGGGATKPGMHEQQKTQPTYIDGRPWTPRWREPGKKRGPDESEPLALHIGPVSDCRVTVLSVTNERDQAGTDPRDPVEVTRDGDGFVITIPDGQMDSRWYRLRVDLRE